MNLIEAWPDMVTGQVFVSIEYPEHRYKIIDEVMMMSDDCAEWIKVNMDFNTALSCEVKPAPEYTFMEAGKLIFYEGGQFKPNIRGVKLVLTQTEDYLILEEKGKYWNIYEEYLDAMWTKVEK